MKKKDLIIFSNSPGEVSGWVQPVIEELNKHDAIINEHRVFLIIHPCQFGSGKETFVAGSFPGIDYIVSPKEYLRYLSVGSWKRRYGLNNSGVILSLGGNLKHPVVFKKRVRARYPLFAYTDNPDLPGWESNYTKIFLRSEYVKTKYMKKGVSGSKLEVVGDLLHSTLKGSRSREEVRRELGIAKKERMFGLLPGSRDFEVHYLTPVFLKVMSDLIDAFDGIKPFLIKSPYVSYKQIEKSLSMSDKIREMEYMPGTLRKEDRRYLIESGDGMEMPVLEGGLNYWGAGLDFALTIPGSNTIQLAYRKIPFLVVAPINKPEIIPFVGILSILKWTPLLGKPILKKALVAYNKRIKYTALPNIYTDSEIVPELRGVLKTGDITEKIAKILEAKEDEKIRDGLLRLSVENDPAEEIVKAVFFQREQ
jgi:lipid-A-disaccharide synthase